VGGTFLFLPLLQKHRVVWGHDDVNTVEKVFGFKQVSVVVMGLFKMGCVTDFSSGRRSPSQSL
jgi:hypothetical protein